MLRSIFIGLSKAQWANRLITGWGFARHAAGRFVAGETREAAVEAVRGLNARGIRATLDFLGENTTRPEDARHAAEQIILMLEVIQQAGVSANVSIKLSQIGLNLDGEYCRENLRRILEKARDLGNFVRIDMEDAAVTEKTLGHYEWARENGFDAVGIVIQSYLYRSEADIRRLMQGGGRVRLCKGAYQEPAEVAFPKKADVDRNYDHLVDLLLDGARQAGAPVASADGRIPPIPAIASHDELRIRHARKQAATLGLPKTALEFQMLYGIRRDLQETLAAEGYPVRVYVPYGTHWYPYFMRRLAERPANVWFFLSNFFRK